MTWWLIGAGVIGGACFVDALCPAEGESRSIAGLFFTNVRYFAALTLIVWAGSLIFG